MIKSSEIVGYFLVVGILFVSGCDTFFTSPFSAQSGLLELPIALCDYSSYYVHKK